MIFGYKFWIVHDSEVECLFVRRSRLNPERNYRETGRLIDGPFRTQEDVVVAVNFWIRQLYPWNFTHEPIDVDDDDE